MVAAITSSVKIFQTEKDRNISRSFSLVAPTVGSSKQNALLRRLAEELPALLRRRLRTQAVRQRQAQRRLTSEQVDQLVAQYQAGDDMAVLATRWGLHRTTVASHLRRAGVERRRQGVPSERADDVAQLYGEGWPLQRIAERYSCDAETVRQSLKRSGVSLRRPWERG